MNAIHAVAHAALITTGITACHPRGARAISNAPTPLATGTAPATSALVIDVGVSDVQLRMGVRDSVMIAGRDSNDSVAYALETQPAGCATADVSPGRIAIARRDQHCFTRWDIRLPRTADVRVRVSVGDVDVTAPIDRAIRLHSDVGSVRLRVDGRQLHHAGSPGSGDELRIGDLATLPRLDVSVGVGSVRAEMVTVTRPLR